MSSFSNAAWLKAPRAISLCLGTASLIAACTADPRVGPAVEVLGRKSSELVSPKPLACTGGATLTANPAASQVAGGQVNFTFASTCDAGDTAEYRLWILVPGNGWTIARDYSTTASYLWDTGVLGLSPGTYNTELDVRAQGSTASWDSYVSGSYALTPPVTVGGCSQLGISESPVSPQQSGTTVSVTGSSTCTGGVTPEYRFWVFAPGAGWRIGQDWSAAATYPWNTTGGAAGTYTLAVDLRAAGTTAEQAEVTDAFTLTSATVVAPPACATLSMSTSPMTQQTSGVPVSVSGAATCSGGGTPEYRYWVLAPYAGWRIIQDWTAAATFSWDTTGLPAGSYTLAVDSRAQGALNEDAEVTQTFTIVASCAALTIGTNPTSPQNVGTAVTVTGTAACTPGGTPEYRYWILPPGGGWTMVQDWSASATYPWNTTGASAGSYTLAVDSRRAGGTAQENEVTTSYVLATGAPSCATLTMSSTPASPQPPGTSISVSGAATCTGTATPEYQFWVQTPGSGWAVAQAWGASPTFAWNTAGAAAGTYTLAVDSRHAGGTVAESEVTASYTLSAGAPSGCGSLSVGSSPASPQPVGATVTVTGTATCTPPGSTAEYRFWLLGPTTSWTIVQDWSTSANYAWATSGAPSGSYTFAVDSRAQGETAADTEVTLNYTINAVPPTANNVTLTTTTGTALAVTLNAADPNGYALTYNVLTQPTNGTLTGTAPNLTYTSNAGFTGTDSFTYSVTDSGGLGSNTATATITVNAPIFPASCPTGSTYTDGFLIDPNASGNWSPLAGSFQYDAVNHFEELLTGNPNTQMWIGPRPAWTDYTVSVPVRINAGGGNGGINFRAGNSPSPAPNDSGQMYYAGISTGNVILGFANNGWTQLTAPSASFNPGTFYTLQVSTSGTNIIVSVDGTQYININDSTYASGGIGLRAFAVDMTFGALSVTCGGPVRPQRPARIRLR